MSEQFESDLWYAFDELGFDYDQVKSLVIAMMVKMNIGKNYHDAYSFLVQLKRDFDTVKEGILH